MTRIVSDPNIFAETEVRKCSFCNKTYEVGKFYPIPNGSPEEMLIKAYARTINTHTGWGHGIFFGKKAEKSEPKNVNEGICLKCILNGLLKICNCDNEKAKQLLELYYKEQIVENLKK